MTESGNMPGVRWHEAGSEPGTWSCLRRAPADNLGFVESRHYVFEKPSRGWSFFIDDEPLPGDPEDDSRWLWQPGFFAGEVTAALVAPDGSGVTLYLLDVAPDPAKAGRAAFLQMVTELWSEDPDLVIGSEPATTRAGAVGTQENAWLAFARLRQFVPDFLRALAPIRTEPRRALRAHRGSAPLHHVRRVDRGTATAMVRSPAAVLLLPDSDVALSAPASARLDVPVVEETLDAAANRAMLALIQSLARRARALRVELQQLVERDRPSETRTSLRARWPARKRALDDLGTQLERAARRPPFTDVRNAEVTAAGLTGIAADPIYARAWDRGWRALRRGLGPQDAVERLWVSPSWEIYERWCFLRLGRLLSATAPEWGWRRLKTSGQWEGSHAGRLARLQMQPTFRAGPREGAAMWSVSRERVPDLVFTIESTEGVQFVVLDAKYRASRSSVLEAMESAHIYQDSLRIGSRRPDASLLLVPAGGGAAWLEDAQFQSQHRVGVHVLPPGITAAARVPAALECALRA